MVYVVIMLCLLCYVFKCELLYVLFFGWVFGMFKMVYINCKDGVNVFVFVVCQGKECFVDGVWVIMFFEGMCICFGDLKLCYKSGGVCFVVDIGVWVIFIVYNFGCVWLCNLFLKYLGLIMLLVGLVILSVGKISDEFNCEVEVWIEVEMCRIDVDSYCEYV